MSFSTLALRVKCVQFVYISGKVHNTLWCISLRYFSQRRVSLLLPLPLNTMHLPPIIAMNEPCFSDNTGIIHDVPVQASSSVRAASSVLQNATARNKGCVNIDFLCPNTWGSFHDEPGAADLQCVYRMLEMIHIVIPLQKCITE